MIVKAVVPVDKRKCKVFLEGDFAFVLYKSEAARFHIEEGNDLPAKTYEMIEEEILLKRARDRALYLLQSQGRTQAEMIKKLKDDGYQQSVTERVLSFLQEYHFIDDNAYTANYIHVNKGRKSKRQITSKEKPFRPKKAASFCISFLSSGILPPVFFFKRARTVSSSSTGFSSNIWRR